MAHAHYIKWLQNMFVPSASAFFVVVVCYKTVRSKIDESILENASMHHIIITYCRLFKSILKLNMEAHILTCSSARSCLLFQGDLLMQCK